MPSSIPNKATNPKTQAERAPFAHDLQTTQPKASIMMITKNEKGEFALYENGQLTRFAPVKYIGSVRVLESLYATLIELIGAAQLDRVNLAITDGLRSWDEQMQLRMNNVIDKSRVRDIDYLASASAEKFYPATAPPGWANHQHGKAYDFNVQAVEAVYPWLVGNAHRYGFVRTQPSQRRHWEFLRGADRFSFVPRTDPSWDGLV